MSYRPTDNFIGSRQSAPSYGWRLVVFLVVVIFIFKAGPAVFSFSGRLFTAGSYPFIKLNSQLGATVGPNKGAFKTADRLLSENDKLAKENTSLKDQLALAESYKDENDSLRAMVGLAPRADNTGLFRVLAGPGVSAYDVLLLDQKNTLTPTVVGQKVLLSDGSLIGEIITADRRLAKAKLYSSYGHEVPVAIGTNNWPGVAIGQGGGNYLVRLARGIDVKSGEIIKATLLGGQTLGVVGQIDSKPSETYQNIYFKVPTNIYQLSWVEVTND